MSNQETLTKAIEKAIANGWTIEYRKWDTDIPALIAERENLYELIFNHDFAKALWGEEDCFIYVEYASENIDAIKEYPQGSIKMKLYQFHLQQMVIAPDPVAYLGENL